MINEGRFIEEENCKMKDVSDKNYTKAGGIMADNHAVIAVKNIDCPRVLGIIFLLSDNKKDNKCCPSV